MKLIVSGVTFSAATMRSPSFSRSSSSTMMTIRPSWISAIASSIVAKCIRLQQIFDVFCHNIELQVHRGTGLRCPQIRILERVRNNCDGKSIRLQKLCNSQTDSIDRDGALLDDVTRRGLGIFHLEVP